MATKPATKKKTVYSELLEAIGDFKGPKKGEDYAAYMDRFVEAVNSIDETDWSELSEDAHEWAEEAFAAVGKGKLNDIPYLEGCPISPPEDDSGDGDAEAEEVEEVKPAAKKAAGRKGSGKAATAKKAAAAPVDEEDDDEAEPAPAAKRAKPKPASKKAAAVVPDEDDEVDEDDANAEEDAEDEEDQQPAKPVAKKGKKAAVDKPAAKSGSRQFQELVVLDPDASLDKLMKRARKEGVTIDDSQMRRMYVQTMNVINLQKAHSII